MTGLLSIPRANSIVMCAKVYRFHNSQVLKPGYSVINRLHGMVFRVERLQSNCNQWETRYFRTMFRQINCISNLNSTKKLTL